ncbi:MAG: SDR family oxidoreductase [Dehalococcoidia bacterium]|nr:SDR family oxidoreductase [Dehalococcoidia bacterium]
MSGRLEGKVAVVTGSGRGIGREVALFMAGEGAKVVVNDPGVNVDGTGGEGGPAKDVVEEIRANGGEAVANTNSVATMEGGESAIQSALDSFGRLDALVCVAGILRDRMIFNMSEDEWDAVIAVHLKGHFATMKPASIIFRQQRYGRIITFSSVSGLTGIGGQSNYGAAKAGIAGLTRVAARDLGRYGVTVNCISPGAATRMTATVPAAADEIRARRGIATTTLRITNELGDRLRTPEMVAPMVAYLASDKAWNINGKVFQVSNGSVSLLSDETPFRSAYRDGKWTLEELALVVPSLMHGMVNPAPPPPELDIPGRPVSAS